MARNRDLSKLLSTANGKITGSNLDVSFENISDTGTEGTKVASGTTAQRGSTTGQWRYNSTTGFFEGRNASGTFSTLEPTPIVTSVDDTEVDSAGGGNQTIVITGSNFKTGDVASFVGSSASFNATSSTIDSATQITAVAPKASFLNAQEPYKVKVTSSSGLAGTSATGLINVDNAPSWTTNAGSLGSISEIATGNHFTVSASDPEGDTVAYSLQSGSLAGLSLNSSTGVISGDPTDVSSDTTNSFTIRATANGKTADRAFTYITTNWVPTYVQLSGSGTWSIPSGVTSAEILVVGGGGSGGRSPNVASGGGGGGGILHASSYTFTSTDISSGIAYVIGDGGTGVGMNGVTDDTHGATEGVGQYGHDTTFAISGGTITAKGGGYAGGYDASNYRPARQGGSGGGGSWDNLTGASSNQATFSGWTKYGNSGGTFDTSGSGANNGSGGGGAGGAGTGATRSAPGAGGAGQLFSNFTSYGASGYFGGGGGGGNEGGSSSASGGSGGGGNGGHTSSFTGSNGTATTGGGGGGAAANGYNNHTFKGGNGGSGTILIRY